MPAQLTAFLTKKHYLHATQLLVSALSLGDGSLEGVEALREVRTDLQAKKQVCISAGFFSWCPSVSYKQMLRHHFLPIPCLLCFSSWIYSEDFCQSLQVNAGIFLLVFQFITHNYLLIWCIPLLKLLVVAQLVKNFPAFTELRGSSSYSQKCVIVTSL